MSDMQQFFTRQKANAGIKLPLYRPDGSATEHYLVVRGVDSDQFIAAQDEAMRRIRDITLIDDAREKAEALRDNSIIMLSSLIAEWSMSDDCNPENKAKLLREAPQIMSAINEVAARREVFYQNSLASSTSMQDGSLDSQNLLQDQTPVGGTI